MPKLNLQHQYLDTLPQPPPLVEDFLYHWLGWLRFLPWPGPRREMVPVHGQREHLELTQQLQSELKRPTNSKKIAALQEALADLERRESEEPDERLLYDHRKGERFEDVWRELPFKRRMIVKMIHWQHLRVPTILAIHDFKDESAFHMELLGAYRQLAGKLCD